MAQSFTEQLTQAEELARKDKRGCSGCKEDLFRKMRQEIFGSAFRGNIGVVMPARDEGGEVASTLASIVASKTGQGDMHVNLIDDASKEECAHAALMQVVQTSLDNAKAPGKITLSTTRHSQPYGVGQSRNEGTARLLKSGADVIAYLDAHERIEKAGLEIMAAKAAESGAIVCAGSTGFEDDGQFWAWGCKLIYAPDEKVIAAKWLAPKNGKAGRDGRPEEPWLQVTAFMGGAYVMSRQTIEKLSKPTGRLWEDIAGEWGFSEEALSLKAAMLGVPILVSRDVVVKHLYRDACPCPDSTKQMWMNVVFALSMLWDEKTFRQLAHVPCADRLGAKVVSAIAELARGDVEIFDTAVVHETLRRVVESLPPLEVEADANG